MQSLINSDHILYSLTSIYEPVSIVSYVSVLSTADQIVRIIVRFFFRYTNMKLVNNVNALKLLWITRKSGRRRRRMNLQKKSETCALIMVDFQFQRSSAPMGMMLRDFVVCRRMQNLSNKSSLFFLFVITTCGIHPSLRHILKFNCRNKDNYTWENQFFFTVFEAF